jgi:predicted Fe-S protein YdhL (DUF1289 family)
MVRDERTDWTKTEDMEMHEVWAPDCAHDSDYTVLISTRGHISQVC